MKFLGIVLWSMAAAIGYGIVHDQVTARVCVEYFTVGHPPVFGATSPTLLGLGWGILATWWVGLGLGLLLGACARLGPEPRLAARDLRGPLLTLLAATAALAFSVGVAGYLVVEVSGYRPPAVIRLHLPWATEHRFTSCLFAHAASYASAFLGGLVVCVQTLLRRRERRRASAAAANPTR